VAVSDWNLSPRGRARMGLALALPWIGGIRSVWCSKERKAREAADIVAAHLGVAVTALAELGENDRSATGYLPRVEFEAVADQFFAHPAISVRGWETAVDAQRRIVRAVDHVAGAAVEHGGDVAIIAHGGVGTLLLCALRQDAISRTHDQPGSNGGNYFAFDRQTRDLHHGWRAIDAS
jgi:broad specificity phosphatase PhoE